MFKHEIFEIFSTFTEEELDRFELFLKSPYFTTSSRILDLFLQLRKFFPEFSHPRLTKEFLYKKISPDRAYNDNTIRSLISRLETNANTFMAVEKTLTCNKDNVLLEVFSERKLTNLFIKEYERCKQNLLKSRRTETFDFHREYLIEVRKYNYAALNDRVLKKKNADENFNTLHSIVVSLFNFFFTELINISLHAVAYSETLNIQDEAKFIKKLFITFNLPKLLRLIQEKNEHHYIIELYIALYNMSVLSSKSELYYAYKKLVKKYIDQLNSDEISFHYSKLISYCIDKACFTPKQEFKIELFNIFKELLEKKYYISSKVRYLRPTLFRSILLAGLDIKEFIWCQDFIKSSDSLLQASDSANMQNFGYAYFYFQVGDYTKTLDYIHKIDIDYFTYLYDIKNLTIKAYYELGYFEEALSFIKSYKTFLKKNLLVTDIRRERHNTFLNFTEKIILNSNKSFHELDFLKHQISSSSNTSYKEWLVLKINKLLKSAPKAI